MNKILNSICHSCVSENPAENKALHAAGSSGSANAAPRMTESGRSMVEMLGVLSVIGVLSVAGIAGYSNAMKKHRANEILNEASKRAVIVAAQAMTGKTGEIALSEFGNNTVSGVTFSKAEIKNNHIVLTLSGNGIADNCAQLKTATGDNTVMKVTKDDCSELTFNADMSVGSGTKEPENKCPAGGEYDEATGACKCADGSGSCCNTGKAVCPDYYEGECLEDYLCCESEKYTWENGQPKCFNECSSEETEYVNSLGSHYCISCPEGEIPYCNDATDSRIGTDGLNGCISDAVTCCDGEVIDKGGWAYGGDWVCCPLGQTDYHAGQCCSEYQDHWNYCCKGSPEYCIHFSDLRGAGASESEAEEFLKCIFNSPWDEHASKTWAECGANL